MFKYIDYFNEQQNTLPYTSAAEEYDDYMKLVEMVVEDLIYIKLTDVGEGAYSRGMVITEKEMRDRFFNAPEFRDRGGYYHLLGDSVQSAFKHIIQRTLNTGDSIMLPVNELTERFSLNEAEVFLVMLAFAAQTDRSYERVIGFAQDDIQETVPTLGLGLSLVRRAFENPDMDVSDFLSPDRGLFDGLFMSAGVNSYNPLKTKLVLTGAALEFILGNGVYRKEPLSLLKEEDEASFFKDDSAGIRTVLKDESLRGEKLFLACGDTEEARLLLLAAAKAEGLKVYRVDRLKLEALDVNSRMEFFDSLSFIAGSDENVIMVSGVSERRGEDEFESALPALLNVKARRPVFMTGGEELPQRLLGGARCLSIKIGKPDVTTRISMWKHFIKEYGLTLEKGFSVDEVADCYELSYSGIKAAVKQAKLDMLKKGIKKAGRDLVTDALKDITTVSFNGLAKEVKSVYTWDDISMNDAEKKVLLTACDRYKIKNRIGESWGITKKNAYGNGVSVLLYGPPGTGKTMAAQIVAREVGLPLYRVDTSQLFSKYIGETQKNLNAVFDEADKSNVILFFDEADALFSKRTDVENSNDRYANQEIAFLLQRVEEYKGMSLLATNYYSGFDKAFVRRITYAVRLEQPDEEARLKLWTSILPEQVPVEKGIDFKFFAREFELTGSNIKAILLSAAYMAGAQGKKLSVQHIVKAMKYEFDKLGMMPDSGKFGPYAAFLYN